MTDELKKAIERMESLPERDQKHLAELIMDEINWLESFQKSGSKLSGLADEALKEYKANRN